MATGTEYRLLLVARVAGGSVFLSLLGLITYTVGGYVFVEETVELAYPFLDLDRDPVLNLLVAIGGLGMFIASLPMLVLGVFFHQNGVDTEQVLLTIILGTVGLTAFRLSVFNIL